MKTDRCGNEKPSGHGELPQTAADGGTTPGLTASAAEVEEGDFKLGGEDVCELSTRFSLSLQRYEGGTREGHFHGEGVAYFEGGHMYKGMFSNGLMDGPGVFIQAGRLKYEGDFVCNMPMGQGTYTWLDGSSYKGEVYNGKRHGTGTFKAPKDGASYRGQWDQGKKHGKGVVYYNQEKTSWYKGDWVKNNREGWGVRCYPSGNTYSGEWKNNLRHGEGSMKWLKLGQQYVGMWQNGVQHGRGTHIWIQRRADGSQYSQSNQYTGDFVQGQRHGQGVFYYAGGAVYEGEWRNNKRHGKGKFTFRDGRVFEGEFVDDQMMTHSLTRASIHLSGSFLQSGSSSPVLGPDMAPNTERLLDLIPDRDPDTERKQVEFVLLRQAADLRSVYSFYSRLGHSRSPDNIFLLTWLQLWRMLKDCNIHHHDITLTQIDRYIREDATTAEIHSPFTCIHLHRFLSCLLHVAYLIYHKDMELEKNLLAACFSKLVTDNILPNAKNVKGFLFRQPGRTVVAMSYMQKCWEIYQAQCKVTAAPRDDQTLTYRHVLWMFKDFRLLDNNLTTMKLLKIITAESPDPSNLSSCLDLEITFLEFFEVLLGSAEVKCQRVSEGPEEDPSLCSSAAEARRDIPDGDDSEKILQGTDSPPQSVAAPVNSPVTPEIPKSAEKEKSSDSAELSTAQDRESQQDAKNEVCEEPQSAGGHGGEGKGVKTRGIKAKDSEVELWSQTIHQFFNHFFFPAFDHNQLVSKNVKEEKLRQQAQRRIALAKAEQRAREKGH